jgi:hypothetical protein
MLFSKLISKIQNMFTGHKNPKHEDVAAEAVAPAVEVVTVEPAVELPTSPEPTQLVDTVKTKPARKAKAAPKTKKVSVTLDSSDPTKESGAPVAKSSTRKKPNIKIAK